MVLKQLVAGQPAGQTSYQHKLVDQLNFQAGQAGIVGLLLKMTWQHSDSNDNIKKRKMKMKNEQVEKQTFTISCLFFFGSVQSVGLTSCI